MHLPSVYRIGGVKTTVTLEVPTVHLPPVYLIGGVKTICDIGGVNCAFTICISYRRCENNL